MAPYWLYFCNLEVDTLRAMNVVLHARHDDDAGGWAGFGEGRVRAGRSVELLRHDFLPMNAICERAEMFEHLIYDRTKTVFDYFDLPFDDEQPH